MNAYLGIAGLVLSFLSLVVALNGAFDNQYVNGALIAVALVGVFMFGYNARAAKDRLNAFVEDRMRNAAERAVEKKMGDIDDAVDGRLVQVFDAVAEESEKQSLADSVLRDLRAIGDVDSMRRFIEDGGNRDADEFRTAMAALVERGDVTGVAIPDDGSPMIVGDDFAVKPEPYVNPFADYERTRDYRKADEQ